MAYELPKLPYAYNALEPHIDAGRGESSGVVPENTSFNANQGLSPGEISGYLARFAIILV